MLMTQVELFEAQCFSFKNVELNLHLKTQHLSSDTLENRIPLSYAVRIEVIQD